MIYEKALSERQRLDKEISKLQKRLEHYPPENLICTRDGAHFKWYQSDGHNKIYIPKSDRRLAEQLAEKKYYTALLNDHIHERNALQSYLRQHDNSVGKVPKLLSKNPEYQKLLSPIFKPLSDELNEWMQTPYVSNPQFPEHLIHKTPSGHLVRSKSEAIIATLLYINQIPFHYEEALTLNGATVYPDFKIRHPITGKVFYWEHLGMMDYSHYAQNAAKKIQLYISNNIYPNIQLILSCETADSPLSSDDVEFFIKHYFL